ncbi:MAG: hypothetical protein ACPLRM_05170, partial [Anaerolineae bacterium]
MIRFFGVAATVGMVLLACTVFAQSKEQAPKPVPKPPSLVRKDLNLPPGAQVPTTSKKPNPSPKEKALAAQLRQLEKQRDALIDKLAQLDRKRLGTQDPAERKQIEQEKLVVVKQLDAVV